MTYYSVNVIVVSYKSNSKYELKWPENASEGVSKEIVGKKMKLVKAAFNNAERKEEPLPIVTARALYPTEDIVPSVEEVAEMNKKDRYFISEQRVNKQRSNAKKALNVIKSKSKYLISIFEF